MRRLLLASLLLASGGLGNTPADAQTGRTLCTLDVRAHDWLRLRDGPSSRHRDVGRIPAGACGITVDESRCAGRWCIIPHGGQSGWANTRFLGIYATDAKASPPAKAP